MWQITLVATLAPLYFRHVTCMWTDAPMNLVVHHQGEEKLQLCWVCSHQQSAQPDAWQCGSRGQFMRSLSCKSFRELRVGWTLLWEGYHARASGSWGWDGHCYEKAIMQELRGVEVGMRQHGSVTEHQWMGCHVSTLELALHVLLTCLERTEMKMMEMMEMALSCKSQRPLVARIRSTLLCRVDERSERDDEDRQRQWNKCVYI